MNNLPVLSGMLSGGETLHLVGFRVGDEEFGVEILKVQEIIRMVPITSMPNAPGFIEGVIDLRGKIIPIIDFRKRFHIADVRTSNETARRIVVIALSKSTIGLVVDRVTQVIKIADNQISPAPPVVKGFDADGIVGVGKLAEKLLIILDVEQMFSFGELSGVGDMDIQEAEL